MDIDLVNQGIAQARIANVKKQGADIADKSLKEKDLKEACAGFEAILLHSMIKSMRESLPGDALFSESHGMNIYKSMYDQYLAEELSRSNHGQSLGLKEFLYDQLKNSI